MYIMRDRELVMKAKEILTGARVLADYMMVGGVRRDINEVARDRLKKLLERLEPRIKYYMRVFEEDTTIRKRLIDVGRLKRSDVVNHGLLGPNLRAAGVPSDSRDYDRYDAYDEVPFRVVTRNESDSHARMMVRWEEALVSLEVSMYVLNHLPQGNPVPDEKRLPRRFPEGEAFTTAEAPRGELTYYVMSKGGDKPYRVKIRTPSFNNIINSGFSYLGHTLADVPVILVSYDPCISCMERAIVIDLKKGMRRHVPLKYLVRGEA